MPRDSECCPLCGNPVDSELRQNPALTWSELQGIEDDVCSEHMNETPLYWYQEAGGQEARDTVLLAMMEAEVTSEQAYHILNVIAESGGTWPKIAKILKNNGVGGADIMRASGRVAMRGMGYGSSPAVRAKPPTRYVGPPVPAPPKTPRRR